MAQGFFTPDEMATPDDIEYRKKLAQSLMGQGMSTEPIKHWTQGAARLAQALVGAGWQEQARADQRGLIEYENAKFGSLFGGPSASSAAAPAAPPSTQPAPSQAMTAADATPKADRGGVGNFDSSVNRLFGFEGGLNAKDTNGTPSNMGINQKWNPNVDVTNLTRDQAREIYRNNYWNAIGGDNLPPALAHVAFDTAAMAGPAKAKALMAQAGNDPVKMLELRQQFLDSLVAQNPEKYGPYAKAWANRTEGLRNDVLAYAPSGAQTASAAPVSYAPPLTPIESSPLPAPKAIASALTGAPAPNAGSLVGMGAAPVNAQGFGINAFAGSQPPAQPTPEPRPQQVAQVLTGQPAAPAAAPATAPVATPAAQSGFDMNRYVQFMGDSRIRPEVKQRAQQAAQMMLSQQGLTPVDGGDKTYLLNKQGQIVNVIPKSRDAADWELIYDSDKNPVGKFNKRTAEREMFAAPQSSNMNIHTTVDGRQIPIPSNLNKEQRQAFLKPLLEADANALNNAPGGYSNLVDTQQKIAGVLKNIDGLKDMTGTTGALWEKVPGSDARAMRARINQLLGDTFLAAFESLKGGGQITEVEGKKAQAAKARLDDPRIGFDAYMEALKDFHDAVYTGMEKLNKLPGMGKPMPKPLDFNNVGKAPAKPAAPASGWSVERVDG